MVNHIRTKTSLTKFLFEDFCCCVSLKNGAWFIGIYKLIMGVLGLILSIVNGNLHGSVIAGIGLSVLPGILIITGLHKNSAKILWWSVYLGITYLCLSAIMIFFLFILIWPIALLLLPFSLLSFYFVMVIRSYTFQLEESAPEVMEP